MSKVTSGGSPALDDLNLEQDHDDQAEEEQQEQDDDHALELQRIMTECLQVPVEQLMSEVSARMDGIHQDVLVMMQTIHSTHDKAVSEKKTVDADLHHLQQVVSQFHAQISQLMHGAISAFNAQ